VETFAGKSEEITISKAIAPVWEANHVWLILAVVILFTGFPQVYSSLSLVLHIPLMMVLLGIICRGSAFTFRQYDVVNDASRKYYTLLFRISSFITPVFLGMVLGAMILGRVTFDTTKSFYDVFISPWLNIFCISMGIFSVFVTAETEGHNLLREFLQSATSIIMLLLATSLCPVIWHFLNKEKNKTVYLRIGVGIQVTLILIGWFYIQFPVLIKLQNGEHLTFFNTQAPPATLEQLLIALLVGLVLVVPGFIYLFRVFKIKSN
jgi:cytochrome d ubiquinol oxidase subunit II